MLESSAVCRCSVRREHDLDRQREQRPQSFDDLLARHTGTEPAVDPEPVAEVDERVAADDRVLRLAASSRSSSGTDSGSKRSSRAPSSIAYDDTSCGHRSSGVQSGCGVCQCQRPGCISFTAAS